VSEEHDERKRLHAELRAKKHLLVHNRNWLRHTAMVPKGFIRFQVLGALNEKPMSGSELMDQIEKRAGGFWKPSPGSIYPLLAWLQDSGFIRELPTENGMKRYELTPDGKSLLDEQKGIMSKFRDAMGFQHAPFGAFFAKIPPEKAEQIRETLRRAGSAIFQFSHALQENYSEAAVDEAVEAVNEAAGKLEKVTKKLQGESKNE
jgi:DNA-binding PadR family transcriptional regulator